MNFTTECLEQLAQARLALERLGFKLDPTTLGNIMQDLTKATKYLLPPPHALNVKVQAPAMKFLKLPYPVCAFEYTCPDARDEGILHGTDSGVSTSKSTKRIALAYDCAKNVGPVPMLKASGVLPRNASGILVMSLYYVDAVGWWSPSSAAGYIDADVASPMGDEFLIDNFHIRTVIDAVPVLVESLYANFGHLPKDAQQLAMLNDVADEVATAVRACLMLNTKNLAVVKVVEAPEKLNKKRAKNNKPPFFEYRTLDIFVSKTGRRFDRKRVDYGALRESFTNMRVDKKWGTVAGHFKLRKTGMFWWSDHARGNPEHGVVQKDYHVTIKE